MMSVIGREEEIICSVRDLPVMTLSLTLYSGVVQKSSC
jgi:hypothetical protein